MRLLIAEDEVDLAEALTVFFEKNHFSVDAVHNGFDAYEYASSGAYDAVILDVMMPKMDGIQVLEKLRQEGVKTPIMMLTAKGQKSDRITGFNAGADDYLPKPFDPDELLSRVRAILRRSEAYQPTVLAYGDLPLLDEAALSIEPGERVGLIGRNGTGKSSLLSVLAGKQLLDDGQIQRQDGLIVHYVEQEPVLPEAPTFRESLIARGNIESIADEKEKWRLYAKLDENLSRFELNPDGDPKLASGGERKRAALALAFTLAPQLMLLDEPTNHLDMRAISLLENICRDELKNQRSLVVITHDRAFLDNVATRIVELDRGTLRSYPGNFSAYEARKRSLLQKRSNAGDSTNSGRRRKSGSAKA